MSESAAAKAKRLKDVRHILLYDASKHIEDDFWKNMLIDLSRGRCPKKMTLDANTLYIGNKRNQLTYFYSNKTPEEIAIDLVPLLRQHLSIQSSSDIKQQSDHVDDQFNEFHSRTVENSFKKIKNKKMKHSLIVEYVLRQKNDLHLGWKQSRILMKLIDNALNVFHTHTSNDVEMENGVILDITDIVYENGTFVNKRYDSFVFHSDDEDDEDKALKTINDIWSTYVKGLTDEL